MQPSTDFNTTIGGIVSALGKLVVAGGAIAYPEILIPVGMLISAVGSTYAGMSAKDKTPQ